MNQLKTIKLNVIDDYKELINAINSLIYTFLYENSTSKININDLINKMKELNITVPVNTPKTLTNKTNPSKKISNTKKITLKKGITNNSNKTFTVTKLSKSRSNPTRKTRCKKGTKFNKKIGECIPYSEFPTLTSTTDMTDDQIKSILGL